MWLSNEECRANGVTKKIFANIQVPTPLQMIDLAIVGPGVLGSLVAEQYRSINGSAIIALVFRSEDAERRDRLD